MIVKLGSFPPKNWGEISKKHVNKNTKISHQIDFINEIPYGFWVTTWQFFWPPVKANLSNALVQRPTVLHWSSDVFFGWTYPWMEEIHLGCTKPFKWDKLPINWCRILAINSIVGWFRNPANQLVCLFYQLFGYILNLQCMRSTTVDGPEIWRLTSFKADFSHIPGGDRLICDPSTLFEAGSYTPPITNMMGWRQQTHQCIFEKHINSLKRFMALHKQ